MDIAATNAIVRTATTQANQTNADAVQVAVLKKALNIQAASAATLLQALPQPALATSGTVGTQVNTFA
ncbi:MAG: putative motility protein [Rhodoferax sp.]|nr:putative motility protein [Rhodoferax sp.]